ncbi:hypothetical protein [Bacteroides sp.]|uniref:hypothetical protein n=1 Tax=Bacteroides sp. TaxID=29523 RepID=UPI0025BD5C37|nr:hypothetical protein [Bacteroides sp.]
MKRNLFSALAVLTSIFFISSLSSCGDSYSPITLTSKDEKTVITNNDTIKLTKFTDGEQYNIKGGNGKYFPEIINKKDTEIFKFSYDGNTISITPVNEGSSYLNISDSEENASRFVVTVEKKDRHYNVESVSATVEGDDLTVGTQKELVNLIISESDIKAGGKFDFQYTNSTNGIVKILSSEGSQYKSGSFVETKSYNPGNGEEISSFKITISESEIFTLYLSEEKMTLSKDVTDRYKGQKHEYNNLEKAYLIYNLSVVPTEDE